jgi:hypothetical protein
MSTPFTTNDTKKMLEILASTTDLQKHMVTQEDKLVTLSDEVSSLKVDQGQLHVTVNNIQSKQLDKEATTGQSGIATEDEKPNVDSSHAAGTASTLLNAAAYKLRFPKYGSTEGPLPWLNRCKQFFRATQTTDDEKVLLAAFYMQVSPSNGTTGWNVTRVLQHGHVSRRWPTSASALHRVATPLMSCHLRLQGSVADYMEAFLSTLFPL